MTRRGEYDARAQKKFYWKNREGRLKKNKEWRDANKNYLEVVSCLKRGKNHGLTFDNYTALYRSQEGRCAICLQRFVDVESVIVVDHDHACCNDSHKSCGKCIRGLLCTNCNLALGKFKDDQSILMRAIFYLAEGRRFIR